MFGLEHLLHSEAATELIDCAKRSTTALERIADALETRSREDRPALTG